MSVQETSLTNQQISYSPLWEGPIVECNTGFIGIRWSPDTSLLTHAAIRENDSIEWIPLLTTSFPLSSNIFEELQSNGLGKSFEYISSFSGVLKGVEIKNSNTSYNNRTIVTNWLFSDQSAKQIKVNMPKQFQTPHEFTQYVQGYDECENSFISSIQIVVGPDKEPVYVFHMKIISDDMDSDRSDTLSLFHNYRIVCPLFGPSFISSKIDNVKQHKPPSLCYSRKMKTSELNKEVIQLQFNRELIQYILIITSTIICTFLLKSMILYNYTSYKSPRIITPTEKLLNTDPFTEKCIKTRLYNMNEQTSRSPLVIKPTTSFLT